MPIRIALVVALIAVVACKRGGDTAPPCGAVGAKFLVLAKDDLERSKVSASMHRAVLDQLPAMRDSLVQVCAESKWSPAVRSCMVQANDRTAFEACEQQLTEEQRRELDRSARGEDRATSASE